MWQKSENGEAKKPAVLEILPEVVILRRNFRLIPAGEDFPEHWEYDEWQMSAEQYEVYTAMKAETDYLTLENEILSEDAEQLRADVDFCLMLLED